MFIFVSECGMVFQLVNMLESVNPFIEPPAVDGRNRVNKIRTLLLGIFFAGLITNPCLAQGLQEGFSGIRWGTSIEELGQLEPVGTKGAVAYYINPNIIHKFADIEVPHVVYGFHDNRFFVAYAHIDTIEVFAQLKSQLQADYGIPQVKYLSESGEPSVYRWKKDRLKLKLKVQKYTRKMKLGIYYTPISKKVNESQQEKYTETGIRILPRGKPVTMTHTQLLEF